MKEQILPVLAGADMNCYSVARAFHEEYGVCAQAFGRYAMGETKYSKIVKVTENPDFDKDEVFVKTLNDFADRHPDKTKVLMGCTDDYAALLIRNRDKLSEKYIVPYINKELMDKLVSKESFYRICDQHGIDYPDTVILRRDEYHLLDSLPFPYPLVIKPSSSIAYWKHPFEGMKKVYMPETAEQAKQVARQIFEAGYDDSLIVQDMVPGADDKMMVLTAYSDQNGKVKMMCLGHVLLEEHTPKAVGNHAAILTEYNRPLMEKIQKFLEDVGYVGYSNFDIKYDERDNTYRVFEINLRQGRSNYYVTGAGLNIARYVVEDRVLNKDLGEPLFFDKETFWHSIPAKIVWEYTADEQLARRAMRIVEAKQDTTTLGYAYDLRMNPLRWLYLQEHSRRYYKKYATYCTKQRK